MHLNLLLDPRLLASPQTFPDKEVLFHKHKLGYRTHYLDTVEAKDLVPCKKGLDFYMDERNIQSFSKQHILERILKNLLQGINQFLCVREDLM